MFTQFLRGVIKMFMSVHKGEGGVKIVPNPVHVVCERPITYYETNSQSSNQTGLQIVQIAALLSDYD